MPVFNIKKKSILLTVSSLVISQFIIHASNFDELDLKKFQTLNQTYNFEDLFDFNKINKVERSTSRESFDWFFNFDNYKISAPQKAKVNSNPNLFNFDIFTGMVPQKAEVQETKVNPNSFDFDIFTGMVPQKAEVQETKVNPNSFNFDIFTGMVPQKAEVQETKVNPNSFNFDIFTGMAPPKAEVQKANINPNSFNFDIFTGMAPPKAEVQKANINPNSFNFDIFTGMVPQKAEVQKANINPNSFNFDIFTGMVPQKAEVQETKVNPNSFNFDIFTGMAPQKSQAQEAKVNSNFFDFFNVMTSQKNENHNQEVVSELKVLRVQLEALTTQYNFNLNVLNEISKLKAKVKKSKKLLMEAKVKKSKKLSKLKAKVKKSKKLLMEAKSNNLFTQLRSENNDRSKQSNSNNNANKQSNSNSNNANKSILSPVEEKIEIFKNNSTSGVIQLTSTGSEKAPIVQLMEYIDQSNNKQGAEKLITHLMQEQNSSDPDRAESIENILNNINSLPKIIRDAHEAQIRKNDQDRMKSICDKATHIEINEVKKIKQSVSSTSVTQINPASLLILFTPQQLSKMDINLVDEIKNYFSSLPVDYRKIIFKNLSSEVSGDKIQIVRNPNNKLSLQALFSSLYESFSQPEKAFVLSSNGAVRRRVEELNKKLIEFLKEKSNIILTPLDPMPLPPPAVKKGADIPPPPPPAAKKEAGAPPPPPPSTVKKGPVLKPAAAKAPALAKMNPVVLTDGVVSIIGKINGTLDVAKAINLNNALREAGYSRPQANKIAAYMSAHLGTDARTAVNTLIVNASATVNPEFIGATILART